MDKATTLKKKKWLKKRLRENIIKKQHNYEAKTHKMKKMGKMFKQNKAFLNNCIDDDKVILYERELKDLEEVNSDGS